MHMKLIINFISFLAHEPYSSTGLDWEQSILKSDTCQPSIPFHEFIQTLLFLKRNSSFVHKFLMSATVYTSSERIYELLA